MPMYVTDANVAYNYQKNPKSVNLFRDQAALGLAMALRDNPNYNRNVSTIFPTNLTTPNLGAGSPTLLAISAPSAIGITTYAGKQISGLGEIS